VEAAQRHSASVMRCNKYVFESNFDTDIYTRTNDRPDSGWKQGDLQNDRSLVMFGIVSDSLSHPDMENGLGFAPWDILRPQWEYFDEIMPLN